MCTGSGVVEAGVDALGAMGGSVLGAVVTECSGMGVGVAVVAILGVVVVLGVGLCSSASVSWVGSCRRVLGMHVGCLVSGWITYGHFAFVLHVWFLGLGCWVGFGCGVSMEEWVGMVCVGGCCVLVAYGFWLEECRVVCGVVFVCSVAGCLIDACGMGGFLVCDTSALGLVWVVHSSVDCVCGGSLGDLLSVWLEGVLCVDGSVATGGLG